VHDACVAGKEFDTPDVAHAVNGNRDDEDPKNIGPIRPQRIGLGQRDHEVGLAELPALGEHGRRRQIARVAFSGPRGHPPLDEIDLGTGERMLSDERTVLRVGAPGRHQTISRHVADLARVLPRRIVRQQAEGRDAARMVAAGAAIEHQGRDVPVEGHDRCLERARGRRGEPRQSEDRGGKARHEAADRLRGRLRDRLAREHVIWCHIQRRSCGDWFGGREHERVNRRPAGLIAACIGLSSLIACHSATAPTSTSTSSTGTTTGTTTITPSLTVGGTTTFTAPNQTSQLTATEGLADGTTQDVTSQATWQSSNTGIATVSATGLVTSVTLGQATITATFQGLTGTTVTNLTVNLTGTWSGSGSDSTGSSQWLAALTQTGTTVFLVSGPVSFVIDGMSGNGQFTGNVVAYSPRVPFVITGAASAGTLTCNLAISGFAQTTNTTFTASYTGTNSCVGPVSSGQFTLTVQ
jgi:hypothetical protein